MRTPIKQFAKDEKVSVRFLYKEAAAKRLVLTKVGARTFIEEQDASRWRALAPKVGNPGDLAVQIAVRAVEALGQAVAEGVVDRKVAVLAVRKAAAASGVNRVAA
jgi:hypothetical protein